ncbi:hypothetical protein GGI42DRAFT_347527 [Trichoderma sp. SZMC 28013]
MISTLSSLSRRRLFEGYDSPGAFSMTIDGGQEHRPRQRRPRARAPSPPEWEDRKTSIYELYIKNNFTLAETLERMKKIYRFHATEKMYKDKFKQWKWSKNMTKALASETFSDNQRRPTSNIVCWDDRMWPIGRIKNIISLSRASGEDSSPQEDCPKLDGWASEMPPFSVIADNESAPENSHGIGGACLNIGEDLCKFLDKGPRRIYFDPGVLYARVREAVKAHHFSTTHSKTLEIGYLLASFYVKTGRINDAHCILDWMTKRHCGDTRSCNARIVTHVLSTIAILRQARRDEEADSLTYRLLKHHQSSNEHHFLLKTPPTPCVRSKQMVEHLLASSKPEELATMSDILERLSTDSNNHKLLQDLLPRYIQKCDQPMLEKQAIHSMCILAAILAKNAQFERAIYILRDGERHLQPLLIRSIDAQCPSELSTLKLAQRLAFTFVDANDLDACSRVLSAVLGHMDYNKFNDIRTGYSFSVYDFLISTAAGLHKKDICEKSRAWMNQALSKSQVLFGDDHECTKRIRGMIDTCTMDIVLKDALRAKGAPH